MLLEDGPPGAPFHILFAHGAGAGMDHPWMQDMAVRLASAGFRVSRFEFPYMQRRRESGARGGPDRQPVLEECWREMVSRCAVEPGRLVLAGKSMGGRIATHIADDISPRAVVCFGYPFHPPGKPETLRTAHLETLKTPTLILQGTRDTFGKPDEVGSYTLSPAVRVVWLEDGDHSLSPRKSSGRSLGQNLDQAVQAIMNFLT